MKFQCGYGYSQNLGGQVFYLTNETNYILFVTVDELRRIQGSGPGSSGKEKMPD